MLLYTKKCTWWSKMVRACLKLPYTESMFHHGIHILYIQKGQTERSEQVWGTLSQIHSFLLRIFVLHVHIIIIKFMINNLGSGTRYKIICLHNTSKSTIERSSLSLIAKTQSKLQVISNKFDMARVDIKVPMTLEHLTAV